jgi:hypothetical protein
MQKIPAKAAQTNATILRPNLSEKYPIQMDPSRRKRSPFGKSKTKQEERLRTNKQAKHEGHAQKGLLGNGGVQRPGAVAELKLRVNHGDEGIAKLVLLIGENVSLVAHLNGKKRWNYIL